jgi:hypothetical protein
MCSECYPRDASIRRRLERADALIAWIDGACTDERPHAEIEAAIGRYYEEAR